MYLLASSLTFLGIALFLLAVAAFVLAIRFFMDSQKRLKELLPGVKAGTKKGRLNPGRSGPEAPVGEEKKKSSAIEHFFSAPSSRMDADAKDEVKNLRLMLKQQQEELAKAIRQLNSLQQKPASLPVPDEEEADWATQRKLDQMQLALEKKNAEINNLRQQIALSEKMHQRFEEVQAEFEEIQERMYQMEQQSWKATELSIRVDHLEQANMQLEKTLLKRDEKLRDLSIENQQLHELLHEMEDKLSEANLQRQQLTKKVHFLEELNSDMKQMAEANRRLKNELNRVAELESMLHLITEERDALLKKRM